MKSKKTYIKALSACIVLASFLSSCIGDDSVDPTPECAITAFSISDIKTTIHTLGYDGSDSTYTRTLSGSDVKFNIDQIKGLIYNIDSLPNWVDITHVVPTITSYGSVYAKVNSDSVYYYITSGSDSIDFTDPVKFLVTGNDGISYKTYTVTISKSIADADSLVWILTDSALSVQGDFRTLVLDDTVKIFQENPDVDYRSVQVFGNQFVGVDRDGNIKTSKDGGSWIQTLLPEVKTLLSADPYYLYGFDGNTFLSTGDMVSWKQAGSADIGKVPVSKISSVCYSSKTNENLKNAVLVGQTPDDTTHSVVWFKVSAPLEIVNQDWQYVGITSENDYALPYFDNMSNAFVYNGAINIIGDGYLYLSYDNGITWKRQDRFLVMPEDFDKMLPTQCVVAQEYIYLIQAGDGTRKGRLWKGYINKLNPAK